MAPKQRPLKPAKAPIRDRESSWINEQESASFWMKALTDLRTQGLQDILILLQ